MSLCIPMVHVLLHAIIDELRDNDSVSKMGRIEEKRWWNKASVWIKFARLGLQIVYMVVAFCIILPGILNIVTEGSIDECHHLT